MKLTIMGHTVVLTAVYLMLSACAPSASQIKKVMKENPDILHAAIEADPKGFFEVVQKVQGAARDQKASEEMADELKRVTEEMKSPKAVEIDTERVSLGSPTAKITIVEWADFNCGHCSGAHETMSKIASEYKDSVRVYFKHLPILAKESKIAAEYMEAISLQSKEVALKFHSELFANQRELREGGEAYLKKIAKELGADLLKIQKDRKGDIVKKRIESDIAEARKYEFNGTPGFMINGAAIHGAYPYEFFKKVVDAAVGGDTIKK